ncbi:UvrB/UvrC motif-containing protein [Candidatus Kaiserbacteria bacterium]|nr:UvrB/UvrC motif-containing protein [Candidatus Kaiserbacteria bacterium]
MKRNHIHFSKIPDSPGVYFFRRGREILYIGKATSLRDRIKSYFAKDLEEVRSPLVAKVIADASRVTWEETDSVLDALILEAKRIKEHKPKGNTDEKDDKSFTYLVVTKEKFPRILVARERELTAKFPSKNIVYLFGPFPSGAMLKAALKIIRRIFPFFDTPFPLDEGLTNAQGKMIRFNQTIGLYPPELDEASYKKTVRNIILLFEAKKSTLLLTLEREMKKAARAERFEEAEILKRQLFALRHIRDVTLIKEDLRVPRTALFRIEAYDTAHLRGEAPRGVMAVVVHGEVVPSEYRTFTIRTAKAGDDYQALQEIIERRATHREWPYPQLIVVDGGRGHLNTAKKALAKAGMDAGVVSVVKDERHKPREILGPASYTSVHESAILLANAEAHRFAIGRHRRALRKRI